MKLYRTDKSLANNFGYNLQQDGIIEPYYWEVEYYTFAIKEKQ